MLEQKINALQRILTNQEQRINHDAKVYSESNTKFQKQMSSQQAKLTEFAIKLKVIVALNKELTTLKNCKLDVDDFNTNKQWITDTFV